MTEGVKDSGDDCDSDSDYEDTVEGTTHSIPVDAGGYSGQESEPKIDAVLSAGAFST